MKKVLFLIHDLGPGGAEKVLINLVNNMNPNKFDITVLSLFDEGIHRKHLKSHIHYKYVFKKMFRGNSHFMKLFPPQMLHSMIVKEDYDIEVAYLEGPCARIIAGCKKSNVKKFAWIHRTMTNKSLFSMGFRSSKEAEKCYSNFDQIVCVSIGIENSFKTYYPNENVIVLYNTNETNIIQGMAHETIHEFPNEGPKFISVGTLKEIKGFDRLLRIAKRLKSEGIKFRLIIVGDGPLWDSMCTYIKKNKLEDCVFLMGNQDNPYKYMSQCDFYVCSSLSEGFSTATTEALILGLPICTVKVSGMEEMLGTHNEYGIIVDNDEEALYYKIKEMILDEGLREHYRRKAFERSGFFRKERTVSAVEEVFLE